MNKTEQTVLPEVTHVVVPRQTVAEGTWREKQLPEVRAGQEELMFDGRIRQTFYINGEPCPTITEQTSRGLVRTADHDAYKRLEESRHNEIVAAEHRTEEWRRRIQSQRR